MLVKVAKDDMISFRNGNEWVLYNPSKAIIFSKTSEIWNEIKEIYKNSFKNIVFGDFPDETDVEKQLKNISEKLKIIEWNLNEVQVELNGRLEKNIKY